MKINPPGRRAPCAAAVALMALAACHSAPTRLYTLPATSPAGPQAGNYHGPAVRVDAVHMPAAFDRIEVITAAGPGELKINDSDHWPAALGQVARQTLSMDLLNRLPTGAVIAPHLGKPDDALGLSVDVLQFNSDAAGAQLTVSWALRSGSDNPISHQGIITLQTDAGGSSPAATARSLSALLGMVADRVVGDLTSNYAN